MNRYIAVLCLLLITSVHSQQGDREAIDTLLNTWHHAAATADFETYFNAMSKASVFVGTDAEEHWDKKEFMAFSKPYFDQGKAWAFTPVERHIFISETGETAWFDELLDTWMQLCRGSGVLIKEEGQWKIAHYVLSMTIPNDRVEGAISLKKETDSILKISLLSGRPY